MPVACWLTAEGCRGGVSAMGLAMSETCTKAETNIIFTAKKPSLFGEGFYNVGVTVCPSGRTIKNEPFLI